MLPAVEFETRFKSIVLKAHEAVVRVGSAGIREYKRQAMISISVSMLADIIPTHTLLVGPIGSSGR